MNNFKQNLDSIWQKAIHVCIGPFTFHLHVHVAILTEI